jgi:hypothetical protein
MVLLLYCGWQVHSSTGLRGVPEDETVPVTFECLPVKGVEETIAALRLLEGVEVGPWQLQSVLDQTWKVVKQLYQKQSNG